MPDSGVYVGRARWAREDGEWTLRFDPPLVVPAHHRARGMLPPHPFGAGVDPAEDLPWHPISVEFSPVEDGHVR